MLAKSVQLDPLSIPGFFSQRNDLVLKVAPQKLKVVSRCFQRRVEFKSLPVMCEGLSFVVHRLVGPA